MRLKGKLIFTWICLLFALAPSSCAAPRPLGLPFSVSQVEKIELYRFVIPAQARKKTISEAGGIQWIYGVLAEAEAADNTLEPESGAQVTSFRFCLSGGSSFEMAYISHEGKTGELKGKNINYQTTEDVSRLWDGFSDEEETPVSVSELPAI